MSDKIENKKYSLREYKSKAQPSNHQRKPVPANVLAKGKAVQFVIAGIVILLFPSYELYNRLVLGSKRKMQTGEILKDKSVRVFSEEEMRYRDKNSWVVRIFGDK